MGGCGGRLNGHERDRMDSDLTRQNNLAVDEETLQTWESGFIVPKRIVVETVFGCNASCPMCLIDHPTDRPKKVMPMVRFEALVTALQPYADKIEKFDLFGLGDPMLDKHLAKRIAMLKSRGFKGIAISTNADLFDAKWRKKVFEAGVDTILISIDGTTKEVHEAARPGTVFERVVSNSHLRAGGVHESPMESGGHWHVALPSPG